MRHLINKEGRECTCCKNYKLWSEFYGDNNEKSGHRVKCKVCDKKARNLSRQKVKIKAGLVNSFLYKFKEV
jgi:hypothetical protein